MNNSFIPLDDEPVSLPSERTMRGADSQDGPVLGRIDQYELVRKLGGRANC